jgi:FAR1 DNA-binding domain
MTTLPRFRLSVASRGPQTAIGPSAPPTVMCLDLRGDDPATSRRPGSFLHDKERGNYTHEWSTLAEFDEWRRCEELAYSIELIASTVMSGNSLWTQKRYYVCSRGRSGGASKYQKKHPERQRKNGTKKTNCQCKIMIKFYPHTSTILGRYQDEHNHEVGLANVAYTRKSHSARQLPSTAPAVVLDAPPSQPLPASLPAPALAPASQPLPAAANTRSRTRATLSGVVHGPPRLADFQRPARPFTMAPPRNLQYST